MPEPEVIDAYYTTEKPKMRLRLIWADRVAVVVALCTAAIFWFLYSLCEQKISEHLFGYAPGSCGNVSDVVFPPVLLFSGAFWFVARLLDFLVTGRVRGIAS